MLSDLGIKPIKNSKNQGYTYRKSANDLYKLFKEKNWTDETINVVNCRKASGDNDDIDEGVYMKDKSIDSVTYLEKLIKELEAQLNQVNNEKMKLNIGNDSDDIMVTKYIFPKSKKKKKITKATQGDFDIVADDMIDFFKYKN